MLWLIHLSPYIHCLGDNDFCGEFVYLYDTVSPSAVMGKLFKEGAKGKEKNFRRANIIY